MNDSSFSLSLEISHQKQRGFITNRYCLEASDLNCMNERRDASIHTETEISSVLPGTEIICHKTNLDHPHIPKKSRTKSQDIADMLCGIMAIPNSSNKNVLPLGDETNDHMNNNSDCPNKFAQDNVKQQQNISRGPQKSLNTLFRVKKQMQYFFAAFTPTGRVRQLEARPQIRQIINDLSDCAKSFSSSRFPLLNPCIIYLKSRWRYHSSAYFQFISHLPLLNSQGFLGMTLRIIILFLNCIFFVSFSLIIVFQGFLQQQHRLYTFTSLLWVAEILLALNSDTYKKAVLVQSRKHIAKIYFRKNGFYDLVPLIFLLNMPDISEQSTNTTLCYVIAFIVHLKLRNVYQQLHEVKHKINTLVRSQYLVELFVLISKLFVIAHVIACLWYIIGLIEVNYLNEEATWFQNGIGVDLVWWKLYLESFYWALTLMTTGSNIATTVLQLWFTSFIMFFTTIAFGYILNVIGIILSQMDEKDENKRKDINVINEFMRKRGISNRLQRRVNLEVEHFYEKNFKKQQEESKAVFEKISKELREEVLAESNLSLLKRVPALSDNFSEEAIFDLALSIEEVFYIPNQLITDDRCSYKDPCIYYILSGQVQISKQFTNQKRVLGQNEFFGEQEFFTGMPVSEFSAISIRFTRLLRIPRDMFLEVIKSKDFEKLCMIKDQILMGSSSRQSPCDVCVSSTHTKQSCPYIHLSRERILSNIIAKQSECAQRVDRSQIPERKNEKYNTLKEVISVHDEVKKARKSLAYLIGPSGSADKIPSNGQIDSSDSSEEFDNSDVEQVGAVISSQKDMLSRQNKQTTRRVSSKNNTNPYRGDAGLQLLNPSSMIEDLLSSTYSKQYGASRLEQPSLLNDNEGRVEGKSEQSEALTSIKIQQGLRISGNRRHYLEQTLNGTNQKGNNGRKSIMLNLQSDGQITQNERDLLVQYLISQICKEEQNDYRSEKEEWNPWLFDSAKEYTHYYPHANYKQKITSQNRYIMKLVKLKRRGTTKQIKRFRQLQKDSLNIV